MTTGPGGRSRVRRLLVAVGVVVVVAAVVGAVIEFGPQASNPKGAAAASDLPAATAEVTRKTLVDTHSEDGTLSHGDTTTVHNHLAGTVTALPAVNSTRGRGQTLYSVDDDPVVLFYGSLPAYRTLSEGMTGPDVLQLEKNLWALGYHGYTVDDTFTWSTAKAVKRWQHDLGLTRTGTVELGRVVYVPHAIRVNSLKVAVGDAAAPGGPILDWSGRPQVATAELDISDEALSHKGTAVKVELPDGSTVTGKVSAAHAVVIPATGTDPATTKIETTVAISNQAALADLDAASVTVDFIASQRKNVLSVPVGALLALAEGGYGVQVVEGGTTRIVPVDTGLFADSSVEVTGTGLRAGMKVGVPS